jgi:hypothetical protein
MVSDPHFNGDIPMRYTNLICAMVLALLVAPPFATNDILIEHRIGKEHPDSTIQLENGDPGAHDTGSGEFEL